MPRDISDSVFPDLLRLRPKEPNLDVGAVRNLPLPGLFVQPSKPRCAHLVRAINKLGPCVHLSNESQAVSTFK